MNQKYDDNMKELRDLYLQRTRLTNRISELEKENLKFGCDENRVLLGKCYKCGSLNDSTEYIKIINTHTEFFSDKYVRVLVFKVCPAILDKNLFYFDEELIDSIKTRYTEISEEEFNTEASKIFERMLQLWK